MSFSAPVGDTATPLADLAWLNDYDLARFICEQSIPVLTGIGHEKDSTLPDEVANTRFDTPSKVIAGIEQQIVRRSWNAQRAWDSILARATQDLRSARQDVERSDAKVWADARAHVARARHDSVAALNEMAINAVRRVHDQSYVSKCERGISRLDVVEL